MKLTFLDTHQYTDHLQTESTHRIYHNPTDQKQYLHYHSAHPSHQKESVPYDLSHQM